jgi:hypothetical protein
MRDASNTRAVCWSCCSALRCSLVMLKVNWPTSWASSTNSRSYIHVCYMCVWVCVCACLCLCLYVCAHLCALCVHACMRVREVKHLEKQITYFSNTLLRYSCIATHFLCYSCSKTYSTSIYSSLCLLISCCISRVGQNPYTYINRI